MKAIRKSDGKVIEVEPQRFMECDGSMYAPSDLDFSVDEEKGAEGDLHISVAKLRDILEDVASSQFVPRVLDDDTIDEIINQAKQSI